MINTVYSIFIKRAYTHYEQQITSILQNIQILYSFAQRKFILSIKCDLMDRAIYPQTRKALRTQLGEEVLLLALAIGDDRREDHQLGVGGQGQHMVDHLRDGLRVERLLVFGAVRRAGAGEEQAQIEKTVEQRFFVDVCVDERDISKCINEQRVILDMRGTMDVFVYVTAISKGVPRISLSADQFLVSGKNGMVIDDFSDIGRSLTYYLDSFENWNQALVECYELGQKYTTSVLLKKWRKVLNFSE